MKSRIVISSALFIAFVLGLLSFHPIARAVETLGFTVCSLPISACAGGRNSSTGPGVLGVSASGSGVSGQTTFPSTSGSNFTAGLLGQDLSKTGRFDVGVWGSSKRGDAVLGTSGSGAGVAGSSTSSVGVSGVSKQNTGVYGVVTGGTKTPTGVYGQDNSSNMNGAGVAGQTTMGSGVVAATTSSSTSSQALLAAAPNGGNVFVGVGPGNYEVAAIGGGGNMQISGEITTSGSCASGCARRHIDSYAATAATPTLEDTGEAQLRGGMAYVRLDPAFADATDARQGYFVLITPESDTRGLYVAQRTPAGFMVRENQGGRTNAPFAYRIVAHPYGVRAARLPYVNARAVPASRAQDASVERQ